MKTFITKYLKYIAYFFSVILIYLFWCILAKKINASLILPAPHIVFKEIIKKISDSVFWKHFVVTFLRIIVAYVITVFLGSIIGYYCGTYKFAAYFFEIPTGILRTTPVISVILIALFWFSSNCVPIFVCTLMTLPIMITNIAQGFSATSEKEKLLEMGRVFHFSKIQTFIYIKIPQAYNNIKSGLISTFGLSWKVVVAGEVLCLPLNAVGSDLHKAQVHLETADIMAETIILICICFIFEKLLEVFLSSFLQEKEKKNV